VLFSVSLASEVIVVATPEPTSLTDAYATIKVLVNQQKRQNVRMVINQTARLGDGRLGQFHGFRRGQGEADLALQILLLEDLLLVVLAQDQ
jgi:MinD superfamily P-loop ATPase